MPSCEDNIQTIFEENPNLTDKEIIAKMKGLKDEKGKRLYKTSTITSRLRQFRVKQRVPSSKPPEIEKIDKDISIDSSKSDAPELKNVSLDGAKKEVEEAFGSRNEMENKVKNIEPQEMNSGHKKYDGRIDPIIKEIDQHINGTDKIPIKSTPDSVSKDTMTYAERFNKIDKRIEGMNREILRLKKGGLSVAVDELIDVQLRESIIEKLDALKHEESQDLSETVERLIEQNNEMKGVVPDFLEGVSLDRNHTVHGKLFMHDSQWKFVKRLKPIIYGVAGAGVSCLSLFALLILLKALGLLPGWI